MMNLSHKKAAFYGLVLAAALTGLIIDRTLSASAASAFPSTMASVSTLADKSDADDQNVIGPAIAAVFRTQLSTGDAQEGELSKRPVSPIRDAFSLSPKMREHYESSARLAAEEQETKAAEQDAINLQNTEEFSQAHTLKGTFIRPPDIWVVVDDLILRVGDELDGFVIHQIDHYRVVFERDENRVVLEMSDTPGSQALQKESR